MTEIDNTWTASGAPPQAGKIGFGTRYCNSTFNSAGAPVPMINATLPRHAWTLNMGAVEGSKEDAYRFNPWRAPGYAPIVDPCGQAGGKLASQHIGGDSTFTENKFAKMGDLGSHLPPSVKKAQWIAGSTVEVAWGPLYNHGGGYQYRLCSAKEALTEVIFFFPLHSLFLFFPRHIDLELYQRNLFCINKSRHSFHNSALSLSIGMLPEDST